MQNETRNIAIVWDFDKTLTPQDSTTEIIRHLYSDPINGDFEEVFWAQMKALCGLDSKDNWEKILASEAPTWMHTLATMADVKDIALEKDFFKDQAGLVKLFPNAVELLKKLKDLSNDPEFNKHKLEISHFIVSAGLKEYIDEIVPAGVVRGTWGCRYKGTKKDKDGKDVVVNVPVFCMDQTMKTRALFEISKGVFLQKAEAVNSRVKEDQLWCSFENLIYIGDGPTDVPALSLTRDRGGYGIVVYNPEGDSKKIKARLNQMSSESRCDAIVPADYSSGSDLDKVISARCHQILEKYKAQDFSKN
ncbi:HAD family hydrolase [Pseudobdellovibrio exovorus]|uniref:Haloacid dehalogenase-like hydrolase n=1 Tax=Pseudobdellovibrio exovorus JSS TaxID=1184267 RepID=M4V7B3_9BACT|nr:HAD family hydrolase [Pseudobdellovibrio exovorus]AGH94325.1 hypothetical protein A11Q_105 [Pseudobdellovibrio exovorus JSS]